MLDFALVREALRERGLLAQRLAPHLVRPVPFLYPLEHRGWERLYVGAGVALYDTMAVSSGNARGLPRHRHLSRRGALRLAPSLRKDALVGAIQYYDAQVDDARHTMAVVRTAASYGALAANRSQVIGFLREGERVTGVRVRDLETDAELRGAGPSGRQRHRRLDRRHPADGRGARPVPRPRVEGDPPRRAAGPHPVEHRPHPAHREERAVRHPVGPALDHRHHRHRLGPRTRPTRPRPAPTSTTCSTT